MTAVRSTFAIVVACAFASQAIGEMKPAKSLEELQMVAGAPGTFVGEDSSLLFDIPSLGKTGSPAKLTVTDRSVAGGKYLASDGVYEVNGKTADAFHVVVGPDNMGGIRATIYRADGIQYGGQVFLDGNKEIVKMEGKAKLPDGKELSFSGDLIFDHVDHDTTIVQAKNLFFGETKMPDSKPEHMKRVK